MRDLKKFYIDGAWVAPEGQETLAVINPATEEAFAEIALGASGDVDRAVAAARGALESFAATTKQERIDILNRIIAAYCERLPDLAAAITEEMGAPVSLATRAQAPTGLAHIQTIAAALEKYDFEESHEGYDIVKEPVGVCGLITPWNWPANQICCKVAPAIAAGCTMVLKPSEIAPVSAHILAEIFDAAGVPKGVFNLVDGTGPEVGAAIASHPGVDMVSFTGSTRAGVEVAKNAAPTVKRVAQELGGKSANIILDDADLEKAVASGVAAMMGNSGQSCNAPSRMLVPAEKMDAAMEIAAKAARAVKVGSPTDASSIIGPLVSETQWGKVQALIETGVKEGAELVAGGPGKPAGLEQGYYVKPTVFGRVDNEMTIAREEIFGPVLTIIPYKDEDEAVAIANDTPYGLSGYVNSEDINHAMKVAKRLRTGNVHLNGASMSFNAPFGGVQAKRQWSRMGRPRSRGFP